MGADSKHKTEWIITKHQLVHKTDSKHRLEQIHKAQNTIKESKKHIQKECHKAQSKHSQ